jgi:hypothetical protein
MILNIFLKGNFSHWALVHKEYANQSSGKSVTEIKISVIAIEGKLSNAIYDQSEFNLNERSQECHDKKAFVSKPPTLMKIQKRKEAKAEIKQAL